MFISNSKNNLLNIETACLVVFFSFLFILFRLDASAAAGYWYKPDQANIEFEW